MDESGRLPFHRSNVDATNASIRFPGLTLGMRTEGWPDDYYRRLQCRFTE